LSYLIFQPVPLSSVKEEKKEKKEQIRKAYQLNKLKKSFVSRSNAAFTIISREHLLSIVTSSASKIEQLKTTQI